MRVKVHPHKPFYDNGSEACISVTPMKKHGRAHYMGTVLLTDVTFVVHDSGFKRMHEEGQRNVHAWMTGDLLSEQVEQYRPAILDKGLMVQVRYQLDNGLFVADDGTDVTDGTFRAGVALGKDCYISKDW